MADLKELWINERMKRLYAMQFCPRCGLLPREHRNDECDMRYSKEENNETSRLANEVEEQCQEELSCS